MSNALRKSERVVVVPYQPKRKWLIAAIVVVCVLLSCAASFLYTAYRLEVWQADLTGQRDSLIEQLLSASEQLEQQQSQLATISMGADIDRQSAEVLKTQVGLGQKTVSELNEELSFYRNLMNPKAGQTGLDAYRFLVYGLNGTEALRYRLVLQQLGTEQKLISVKVKVTLLGSIKGEPTQILLQDTLAEESAWSDTVKFRYYHNLDGRFTLPEDFTPEQVEVVLTQSRRSPATHIFEWELLE